MLFGLLKNSHQKTPKSHTLNDSAILFKAKIMFIQLGVFFFTISFLSNTFYNGEEKPKET